MAKRKAKRKTRAGKRSTSRAAAKAVAPRVPGLFLVPSRFGVIDATRTAIRVETITGGVPDASDQLPEGVIVVSP